MFTADTTSMPGPSFVVLATMLVMVAAASGVFWMLTRRWIHGRQMGALYDWARANSMRLDRDGEVALPEIIAQLAAGPQPLLALQDEQFLIVQLQTAPLGAQLHPQRWNVLIRPIPARWPATALRPADMPQSFVDFFALPAVAGLLSPERFTLHGEDRPAAARLAASPLGALLPADVGLMLIGDFMLLDFSSRPFDGTEFSRLRAVSDQLISS